MRESPPMDPAAARLLNPLQLAYIGDAVWSLLVRMHHLNAGQNLRHMHDNTVAHVNAAAQAAALNRIAPVLSEEETAVVLRGRNAHPHHAAPRHQHAADYSASTGLEALIGYLYVTGQEERILQLCSLSRKEEPTCLP